MAHDEYEHQRRQTAALERIAELLEMKITADDLRTQWDEQEADRNARGVKPGEHLIAAADAVDVGRAELDGLNQDQFTAVHALLRRLEREQPGIVTDAELSAICGLPPWWKPLRQREPGSRLCCHTTGPNHHPACTTNRTEP